MVLVIIQNFELIIIQNFEYDIIMLLLQLINYDQYVILDYNVECHNKL